MLAVAFRSVLVPIKAIIMNTLSVSATFGLIVLVFQHGVGARLFGLDGPTQAIFVVVPVLVFAVVFGLSMDYEVFLLSRIKEAYDRTGRNAEATMEGLSATASVITSAALIMILVFGVFAFARVLVRPCEIVILDEATSALDAANEASLYRRLRDTDATMISIAHRAALVAFHDRVLQLDGEGGWRIVPAAEFSFEDVAGAAVYAAAARASRGRARPE